MEVEEADRAGKAVLHNLDIVSSVFTHLSSPRDVIAASAVCRVWRTAILNHTHLRAWTLDDTLAHVPGSKTSTAPVMAKTPPPKQWVNPTTYSPLASFKMPKSLLPRDRSYDNSTTPACKLLNRFQSDNGDTCVSPRTPSPIREIIKLPPLLDIVKDKMVMGRLLGDIDIVSSRMNDDCMQLLLKKCPRLHTFRLVHTCALQVNDSSEALNSSSVENEALHQTSCSCSLLTNTAFAGIHKYCPVLVSVTLVLQHVTFRKMLRKILMEIGRLSKLQTLSVELRVPSFGQSTKSKVIWESHVRVTEQEIYALIQAGPPPLRALALNRCDLTGTAISALSSACPGIEALDLQSDFEDTKEPEFLPRVPSNVLGLTSLSAAAFGVILDTQACRFDEWRMPALKRLRLETRDMVSVQQLQMLKLACPELESLHLIWNSCYGVRETHLYPFSDESISTFWDSCTNR